MSIKKIRKQLKKINTLFSTIEEEGHMNAIEQDLMKTYILSLYEQVISRPDHDDVKEKPVKKIKVIHENNKEVKSESIFANEPEVSSVIKEPIESLVEQEFKAIKNGTSSPTPTETVIDLEEEVEQVVDTPEALTQVEDEKLNVLFESDNSNELSNRLSKLPLTDLNAAFGLNEKIFNINELFNGKNTSYQETINKLNQFSSMEEAREYLTNEIVNQYEWLDDHKIKKASNFIKVIQRRYM